MILGQSRSFRQDSIPVLPMLALILCFVAVATSIVAWASISQHHAARVQSLGGSSIVYFAPGGSPTKAVVAELAAAHRTVHVQAYSFTSAPIAKALVDAKRRGVNVEAILDKSNERAQYSSADFLAHEGVETYIDSRHAIAHNKIMIIDDSIVLTGSFNYTKAAEEKNAENLLVVRDESLAREYEANWEKHLAHSESYAGR
jgi:phosphatidylserine/phosphatidylglycerophosphate/cardiolipin synthase-like enzyme